MQKTKYYTSRYDVIFKNIVLSKSGKEILKAIVESVIKKKIETLEIVNSELKKKRYKEKGKTVDLLVKSEGKLINIEINNYVADYIRNRNLSYLASNFVTSINKGEDYISTPECIQINLTWKIEKEVIMGKYMMLEEKSLDVWSEKFIIYEIYMEKLMKIYYNKDKKLIDEYKYLIMLDLEKEELSRFQRGDKIVKEYNEELEKLNNDETIWPFISPEEDELKVKKSNIEIGRREGFKEGIEKGIEQEKIKNAKKMLEKGIDISVISEITGLNNEQIEKLK